MTRTARSGWTASATRAGLVGSRSQPSCVRHVLPAKPPHTSCESTTHGLRIHHDLVGKSTFASMLAEGGQARQVTLDDPAVLRAAEFDPAAFVMQADDRLLIIDEIQRAPQLILAIKATVDRDRRPGRFLLTGSSDLLRMERTPDSLAGRAVTVDLRGFSQGELTGVKDDFAAKARERIDYHAFETAVGRADYVARIASGAYPEVVTLPARPRAAWIDGYVERIVQRDVADISNVSEPMRLRRVLELLAANQAGELVPARLARSAGIPETTLRRDLDLLRTLYLVDTIPPYSRNLTARQVGRHKAMVSDTAVALRLTGLSEARLADLTGAEYLGPQLEGFVATELLRQRGWSDTDFRIGHFRDRTGIEVDLIIEYADGDVVGLEVKAGSTPAASQFTGLKALRERLGERFRAGIVLNTAAQGHPFGDRLGSLPVAALWES